MMGLLIFVIVFFTVLFGGAIVFEIISYQEENKMKS